MLRAGFPFEIKAAGEGTGGFYDSAVLGYRYKRLINLLVNLIH